MNKALMTQAEYAAYRGVKPSAVSNWKKADHLVFAEGDDGRLYVDRARTDARLNARIDQTRGRPTSAQAEGAQAPAAPLFSQDQVEPSGLAQVRTDLIRQQTIGKTLDNARRAGELVPLEEFVRRASEFGRLGRERMLAVVRNTSERLAAERDPRQITLLLSGEIDRAFAELADQVENGALVADDDDGEPVEEVELPDLEEAAAG